MSELPNMKPPVQRQGTLLRKGTHQLSNFHFEALNSKQESEQRISTPPNKPNPTASNPWAFFQLKPGSSMGSKASSKKSSDNQPKSESLSDPELDPTKNQFDASEKSLDELFEAIETPDSTAINIPKQFVNHDNKLLYSNNIIPNTSARYGSNNDIRAQQFFEKSILEPHKLSFDDPKASGLDISALSRSNLRSQSAQPSVNVLDVPKNQSDQNDTKESYSATKLLSNFWRENVSPFFFRKKSPHKSDPPKKQNSGESGKGQLQDEESNLPAAISSQRIELSHIEHIEMEPENVEVKKQKRVRHIDPRVEKMLILVARVVFLPVFVLFCAIIISLLASFLTYSGHLVKKYLWIDEFSDGFLLGSSLLVFVNSMTKCNYTKPPEPMNSVKHQLIGKHKGFFQRYCQLKFMHMLTVSTVIVSSLMMVAITWAFRYYISNPFAYLAKGIVVLVINILIIAPCLNSYYKYLRKQNAKKKVKGFFGVSVYKDFMTDLSSTRAALEISRPKVPQESLVNAVMGMRTPPHKNPLEPVKYKFDVITLKKILGSQVLLVLLYIQLLATTGFAYLQKGLEEGDTGHNLVVLVIVGQPVVAYMFKFVDFFVNNKAGLKMDIFINYTNYMVFGVFPRITYLFLDTHWLIFLTTGLKVVYKVIMYTLNKREIEALEKNQVGDFTRSIILKDQSKSNIDNDEENISGLGKKKTFIRKRKRVNTVVRMKQEKLDAAQRKKKEDLTRNLMLTMALTELSDLTFCLGSLLLLLYYKVREDVYYLGSFIEERSGTYLFGTWVELAINYGVLALLIFFWGKKGGLKDFTEVRISQVFFRDYIGHFCVICIMVFFNFLNIIQIFDGTNCCNIFFD